MVPFFHSWRRKIGVITLMLALVFTCGWVRSFGHADGASVAVLGRFHVIESDVGELMWFSCDAGDNWQKTDFWSFTYTAFDTVYFPNIGFADVALHGNNAQRLWFSYWEVVLPLGVISFLLLFKKQGELTPVKRGSVAC